MTVWFSAIHEGSPWRTKCFGGRRAILQSLSCPGEVPHTHFQGCEHFSRQSNFFFLAERYVPMSVKKVSQFLWLPNYFHRFNNEYPSMPLPSDELPEKYFTLRFDGIQKDWFFFTPLNALVKLMLRCTFFSGLCIWCENRCIRVQTDHFDRFKSSLAPWEVKNWKWRKRGRGRDGSVCFAVDKRFLYLFNLVGFISLDRASQFRSVTSFSSSKNPVHVSSLLWRNCFALTGGISNVFITGKEMGPVHITSWYPNFNGSHFGLPPNEIHRMTGLGSKIMWTMTYSQMPHWLSKLQVLKNVPKVKQIQIQTNGSFLSCKSGFDLAVCTVWEMSLRSSLSRCSGVKNAFFSGESSTFGFFICVFFCQRHC